MSNFPTCQVCHQSFFLKGPAPLLLPCLHNICETCVTAAGEGVLSCSTCQRDVNLTETRLQKDVITEKELLHLTVKHNPELVLCTHEEDGNQAVCWCKECEDFFCENCQMVHNSFRGTRMHSLQDMGELEVDTCGELKYCTVHPNFPADTLDEDCKMFTCLKCRRGDHSEHRVVFVEEIADIARKQLTTMQKDVNSTIDKHGAHLAAAKESLRTSEQTYRMLPDKISHTFHSLTTVLDQRGKELQIELQQQKEKSGEEEIKMKRSETCLKRCKVLSEYITKTLQYCSMHDLLDLSPLLETIALDNISSDPSGDYQPCPLPVFNIQGLEMLKSTLANFGCIATEDDLFISQTKDTGTQTEEDSRLERAAEEIKQLKSAHEKLTREKGNSEDAVANVLGRSSTMSKSEIDRDQSAGIMGYPSNHLQMDKRNFPKCSFCQSEFWIGGPVPFLLRCQHDLCGECLDSLGSDNSRSELKCLICDTIQNPNQLQQNLSRQRDILDLTARYRRSELVCKHQYEDEEAVSWCPQCDRLLCITCRWSHENELRHTIFNIPKYPVEAEESSDSASRPQENPVVTRTGQAAILPTNERPGTHMTVTSSKPMEGSVEVAMETDTPKNSGSVVDPPEHPTQQESPSKDLDEDIKWWKQHHQDKEITKENVDNVWDDLFTTRRLTERLLEERKGGFLMKRHEELKKESYRQQAEIEKLKKSKIKPKPLVSLHILSAWQSLPVEEIARRISVVLERQKIDMRFNVVTDPAEVTINSRPLLVLCINNSRLQTDVSNALKDIQVDDGVCLVVLHHKDQISKPVRGSQKLLSTTEFRSLGAVADMQFWRKKGVYSCGQNGGAAEKIADYLVRYARPGFQ